MYNYKYVNKDSLLMRVELSTPRIWSWSCLQALGHALQSELRHARGNGTRVEENE